jgi:hypothetical protein
LLIELKIWLEQQLCSVSAKSTLAQAIGYALSRWLALICYLNDGPWRSTTTPSNAPSGRWLWGARTTCSLAPTTAVSGRL